MFKDLIDSFITSLFQLITNSNNKPRGVLIKRHFDNLESHGEFSIPLTLKQWQGVIGKSKILKQEDTILNYCGKTVTDIITGSESWCFTILNINKDVDRLYIHLDRRKAILSSLINWEENSKLFLDKMELNCQNILCESVNELSNDLTSLRLKYLKKVVENLYIITCNEEEKIKRIYISSKSTSKGAEGSHFVLCGAVLNAKTGLKECTISADDYIKKRHDDMTLIAQHKYGVRVSSDSKWRDFLTHLGISAVIFELLEIKPSSAVKINFDCHSSGSSKGSAFVLYNCARLESILRSYNDKVNEGSYPKLPPMDEVDFTLLVQEDEWHLVFNYVLGFPSLISSCVTLGDNVCEFHPHKICSFLSSLVKVISQYYRKVRILTEPRTHLLPVMYARIYLLICLKNIMKTCLRIIDIKSVSQMYFGVFFLFLLHHEFKTLKFLG